jgi:hypothetical protein
MVCSHKYVYLEGVILLPIVGDASKQNTTLAMDNFIQNLPVKAQYYIIQ